MRPLPSVVGEHSKYQWGLAALLLFVALYTTTNALHWREPNILEPGALDDALPLMPETVWMYASYIFISVAAYAIESDDAELNRFLYAQLVANVLSALFFVMWPTTFLRPPLPDTGSISVAALQLVWLVDEPVNCFPSLHVSSSMLAALMMWRRSGLVRTLFLLWAVAIALSTMTTKQHHSADVLAGVVLALVLYWLFFIRASVETRDSKVPIQM